MAKEADYGRKLDPLPGEEELDALSGLSDLVEPFIVTSPGAVAVAPGAEVTVVATNLGKGYEGLLVALGFNLDSQDYQHGPFKLQKGKLDGSNKVQLQSDLLAKKLGLFMVPVGSLTTPLVLPYPIKVGIDTEAILTCKNLNAAGGQTVNAQGVLYGICWSSEQNRDVRRALFGMSVKGPIWPRMFNEYGR